MTARSTRPEDEGNNGPEEHLSDAVRLARNSHLRLDLAAGIAHDMHTPLAVIMTSVELLGEDIDPADRARLLNTIRRQTRRLESMMEDLLEHARVPADAVHQIQDELVDVTQLVREVTAENRRLRPDRDLVLEAGRSAVRARVDREKVRRILQNLLDNAFQYSPSGSPVTLRLLRPRGRAHLVIEVEDKGPGIPEADELSVFNPFTRLASSTGAGYGLGLYTVRCLAEAHGGSVWVERRNRPGACLKVMLPLSGPGADQAD